MNPTYTAEENATVFDTICESDLEAYLYEGKEYSNANGAGSFSQDFTFQTINGCDSIVTVKLTVNPTYTADETTEVDSSMCEADFATLGFKWGDSTWIAPGTKDVVFSTVNGCDSIVTVTLNINDTYTAEENQIVDSTMCEVDFEVSGFTWGDSTWIAPGTKNVVFKTVEGCDSTVTVNLTVMPAREETIYRVNCDIVRVNDSTYTESGIYTQYLQNSAGCDSILTIDVTILESTLDTIDVEGCDSVVVNGTSYLASGTYTQNLINTVGCDSTLTVNVTILKSTFETIERVVCDQLTINDSTYTASGTYVQKLENAAGCDSILTINLIVNDSDEQTVERTACDFYELNGITYTESGIYTQHLITDDNCDFTITLDLTILNSTQDTIYETACDILTVNGIDYYNSGVYMQELSNEAGCDSTLTIVATVLNSTFETIEVEDCDMVTVNDSVYMESGTYVQHLTNASGCDSTLTIVATVLNSTSETIEVENCGVVTVNDSVYTESGTYFQYLTNEAGCDSTLTIVATVLNSTLDTIDVTDCETVTINGETFTQSGTYVQNLTNTAGCDSTLTINLTILSENSVTLTAEASDLIVECDGQGNTEDLENWLQTIGTTGAAEAGFGTISWTNDFESLTLACCNTGSATVTFTAADACGNTVSTTATFTIIDTDAPTFSAPEDITIYSGEECQYDASVEVTGDVTSESDVCCAELDATYTDEVEQGSCAGEWVITRTWNLADACGNQAETQVQIITVLDTVAPTAVCSDVTIQLDENGLASINAEDLNGESTDNCGIDTIFISQYDFTCDNIGINDVTLTVIDNCGNTSTCTATVTVESGAANCGNVEAEPDVLDIVVCKGREVSGSLNILDNDNLNGGGFTLSATNLPEGVQLDLATGELTYYSEVITATTIQFTYTVCHDVYTNDCSEALVTINVLVDTDCDGVPDVIDIDDDDDGILDVDEESYALNQETLDSDGDGIVDRLDIDSDNDGIPDNIEWQQNIAEGILYGSYDYGSDEGYDYFAPLGSDENGDGWDDRYDRDGIYYPPVDMDGDGTPDYLDEDSDGDGIADWIEGWDAAPHDTIADTDFIGTDADGDGLDDAYDSYDTNGEWLHGLNAIGSYAPLQDMAADTVNNIRDWRDVIESPEDPNDPPQATAIFIPNGFSPNGDTYNDYFQIVMKDDAGTIYDIFGETFPDAKIEIYNRWGNLIYEKSNYGNYNESGTTEAWWNGKSMNDMQIGKDQLPTATYFYILYLNNGNEPITGSVFLNN